MDRSEQRIFALEQKIKELERKIAHFQFQWLDRNAYGNYKDTPEQIKAFYRGDGWRE